MGRRGVGCKDVDWNEWLRVDSSGGGLYTWECVCCYL